MMSFAFVWFLLPGFALVAVSSFTAAMCRRWGTANGERMTAILRTYLGMPLIAIGVVLAIIEGTPAIAMLGPW